ncbi:MAG: hypothetical protein Q9211_006369, partial [Gyalolechia sp. 1 TL-2023]
ERTRREGGGREIDEDYDDCASSGGENEGGDGQHGQDGQNEAEKQNEAVNQRKTDDQNEAEKQNEAVNQRETDDPEKQSEQNNKDPRRPETMSPSPRPEPSGTEGKPSKIPVEPPSPPLPPPPRSPSPPLSPSENQSTNVERDSSHTPSPGKETFASKHPLYKPMPYDAPTGMTTRGPLRRGDEERLGVDAAEFVRSHHGYEEGWVGRKFLGQGAAGCAGMWEKRDADGKVLDRVCIKQTQAPTFSEYNWHKPSEVEVMEDLQDTANNGTVQLRAYRRYPMARAHRIYMEYCEHGDLEKLISRYRSKRQYIPEEFIWDAFYHLANACRVMERGPRRPQDERRNIYIHRDIKTDNTAPGGYDQDCIPIYPTTKLGDFGFTRATGLEDPLNPSGYKGTGTVGYRPPEQKVPAHIQKDFSKKYQDEFVYAEITDDEPKFGSESNVWGVGVCIYKLIWLTDASYDFYDKMKKNEEVIPKIKTTRTPEYSQELRDLVHECLNFSPLKRPDPSTLISRIRQARSRFREQWKEASEVPSESLLYYTDDALEEMEFGTWIKRRNVHEDAPPPRYSDLSDPYS